MIRTNEQGISRILLIVGITLLGILIIAAVLLFDNKSGQKSNQSSIPYLNITEWNVQLPLSEGNRDMYYTRITYAGERGEGVKIYSKDIDELKNANGASCRDDNFPIMVISRVSANRGIQMSSPSSPDYDTTSGPYKTIKLQEKYAFGTDKVPGIAPCVNLNNGTDQPFKGDKAVSDVYQAKRAALDAGFIGLQTITTPTKNKK